MSNDTKLQCSWAEEVQQLRNEQEDSNDDSNGSNSNNPQRRNEITLKTSRRSQDREISLEFIDGENEKKFERLVKEDKLKTPFKRRRSHSPNSTNSENGNKRSSVSYHRYKDKRLRHNGQTSTSSYKPYIESDPAILERRQKQIDYGKNTIAYEHYVDTVPRSERTRDHPQTPNKYGKYSRNAFDSLIKIWRKKLHCFDPPSTDNKLKTNDMSSSDSSDSE